MKTDGWPPWPTFEEEPTREIPRETMREVVDGHLPVGPTKPTRNLRTGATHEKR